jgi:hypothetical protein
LANGDQPKPAAAIAKYNPRTGEFVGPDGNTVACPSKGDCGLHLVKPETDLAPLEPCGAVDSRS